MKRFLLTISLLAILVSSTLAQITLTIEDVNTSVGSNIPIELNATNFNDVGAVSIRITFDPAVLEFVELQNPALTTNLFVGSGSGFLTIGWFNLTPANLGDAKIGDMIFNYFGGTSAISFEVPPTEISNSSAATIALTTVNGSITGGAPPSLGSPTLEAPINGATNQSLTPTLNWSDVATATMYDVQVATEATFTNILVNQQGLAASTYSIPGGTLSNSTTYFWRARAKNGQNTSTWSSTFTFVTLSGGGSGDVSLTIETVTVPPNTEIKVPITVTNFNSIGSVSLRINFDNSKLTFKSLVNKTSKTFTGNAVDDKLNIFWFDATGGSSPLSIGDGDLLEIVFDYTDGNIALSFDQPSCQISNSANQPLTASYTDGTIIEGEALPSVPTLSTPSDNATDVSLTPTLEWNTSVNANSYNLQLASDVSFTTLILDQTGLITTSLTVATDLAQNTEYFWRVSATGNSGTSGYSDIWSFTTLLLPLPAPTLLTPSNASLDVSLTPILDWSDVNEATSYRVQVSTSQDFGTLILDLSDLVNTDITVAVNTLQENVTYYWRANATDGSRVSDWSSVFSFTTLVTSLEIPVLQSPANGSSDLDPNSVELDWSDVNEATSYDIQLSGTSNFGTFETYNSATSNFTLGIGQIDYESQFFWRVKAKNATKESDYTAAWSFSTMPAPLDAPGLIAPADGATNVSLTLTLDWGNVSGATGYGLQIATDNTFTSMAISATNLNESTYSIPNGILSSETMYYWRVNATDGSRTSDWSEVRDFTTQPAVFVETYLSGIPDDFALLQNYPNPFNPSTNIRFALPEASEVKVAVVDLLGRVVEVLFNGSRPAGYFELSWDARNISSGTYIYRIDAKSGTGKDFSQMKKMLFVK